MMPSSVGSAKRRREACPLPLASQGLVAEPLDLERLDLTAGGTGWLRLQPPRRATTSAGWDLGRSEFPRPSPRSARSHGLVGGRATVPGRGRHLEKTDMAKA